MDTIEDMWTVGISIELSGADKMSKEKPEETIIVSVDDSPIYNTLKEHQKRREKFNQKLMEYVKEYALCQTRQQVKNMKTSSRTGKKHLQLIAKTKI